MKIRFSKSAKKDFDFFKTNHLPEYEKIKILLADITKTPFIGLGKPEPLKGDLKGYYSRRISKQHRLVYSYKKTAITNLSCRFHYI